MLKRPILAALVLSCSCQASSLAPLPEVVIALDTDLPAPLVASRVRVDLYSEDGTWFDSVEFSRPDPRDWPVSFGVYSDDPSRQAHVWVRARVFPDGRTRDYRGDNPHTWGGAIVTKSPPTSGPRLLKNAQDVTPLIEPDPLSTVDRLVRVSVVAGKKTHVGVTLHGACLGTSAILATDPSRGPVLGEAQSCVDTQKQTVAVGDEISNEKLPTTSLVGTWLGDRCPPADASSARVCIPGGATILGTVDPSASASLSALPVRVFGVHTFWMDRREVSVGRMRDALARGFKPTKLPAPRNQPLADTANGWCSWSDTPMGREDVAVTCLEWQTARQMCQFSGGDLPTEAQWEHATTVAGRSQKTRFSWGNDLPDCDRAVFGRSTLGGRTCKNKPQGVALIAESDVDVTSLGVMGLAGGVGEWTLDVGATYVDACWGDATLIDPLCGNPDLLIDTSTRTFRGFSFAAPTIADLGARFELGLRLAAGLLGFRCVHPEGP